MGGSSYQECPRIGGRLIALAHDGVELSRELAELELELRGVDTLGASEEDAALDERKLFFHFAIRDAEALVPSFDFFALLSLEIASGICLPTSGIGLGPQSPFRFDTGHELFA